VHHRVRLGILAVLADHERRTFTEVRDELGLLDGTLARHLRVLETAKMVRLVKTIVDGRPRTWVNLTRKGREALEGELRLLWQLMSTLEGRTGFSVADRDATRTAAVTLAVTLGSTDDDQGDD
jgi:predicted ArsR family transcriptional regulator